MFERRSLRLPITLGVTLIVLVVTLIIGWVLITVFQAHWLLLTVGTLALALVLAGVVIYLTVTVKTISLNQRQSNFMDSVTHELKSPIASLKLYLQTLTRRPLTEPQREQFYRSMLDDLERLDGLINHLLDAARLERPLTPATEEVRLADLIAQCAEAVCLRHHVPLESIRLDLDACLVRGRRVDLEMIVRNVLDNAVKYAGDPPQVEVVLRSRAAELVKLRVADNGRGIPPPLRRKIFGRFVRLGLELERDKPGTGLGLYIVHTLVRRMRGRVFVHDREPGPGTAFEIELPLPHIETALPAPEPTVPSEALPPSEPDELDRDAAFERHGI